MPLKCCHLILNFIFFEHFLGITVSLFKYNRIFEMQYTYHPIYTVPSLKDFAFTRGLKNFCKVEFGRKLGNHFILNVPTVKQGIQFHRDINKRLAQYDVATVC